MATDKIGEEIAKLVGAIVIIALAVLLLIFGPLITIWSWNQLFGDIHMIQFTFTNWLAVVGLGMFFRGVKLERKSK